MISQSRSAIVVPMRIPHTSLSSEALAGVIEEYVTRDGTELSEAESKVAAVHRALERGDLVLVFDTDSETCTMLSVDEAREAERLASAIAETDFDDAGHP